MESSRSGSDINLLSEYLLGDGWECDGAKPSCRARLLGA
uniref:Uncharacterized protein n=1 Tax=Haloferax volcanii (strain ATCC 29605 / DSM 3757 / JCM 8879 / NBRC 14742 / NCIMB 2012 / VKM B-1768 / DS2) TaxID=309800 RepID=D4GRS2_HALVD